MIFTSISTFVHIWNNEFAETDNMVDNCPLYVIQKSPNPRDMLIRLMDILSDDRTKRLDALILSIPTGPRFLKNCNISHDSLSDDNIGLINP